MALPPPWRLGRPPWLLGATQEALFANTAFESLQKQASIEAEPQEPFKVFLAQWNEASL